MAVKTIIWEILCFVPNPDPDPAPMDLMQVADFRWRVFEHHEGELEPRHWEAEDIPKTWQCRERIEWPS